MSLDDFFEYNGQDSNKPSEKEQSVEENSVEKVKSTTKKNINIEFQPRNFDIGENIDNIFLLDVKYDSRENLAQCLFYHLDTQSMYKWNDNTGHQPYLLTLVSADTIEKIDQITKSSEFVRIEEVEKYLTLEGKTRKLTKVIGSNPLAIGGKSSSFREFIDPAYEADIRYHFNYVADKGLTPGTYYQVVDGELMPKPYAIDKKVEAELLKEFSNEGKEQLDMLDEYMPLLFQDIPDILRCAFDIEVGSVRNRLPNPNNPQEEIISIALSDSQGRNICWVFDRPQVDQDGKFENVDLRRFADERSMLEDFFYVVDKYPIVISFNGDSFDCPYLLNRAVSKLKIPQNEIPMIRKRNDIAFENGVHLDLYKFFRQASIRLYAFGGIYERTSLDELSQTLLNANKVDHPDVWINEMDLALLVKYNVRDAQLTLQLTQFDNNILLNLIFILTRICKMPLYDFTRIAVSGWLQMWLIYEHRKRNYLIPQKREILAAKGEIATSDAIIEGKKFQGAIVLDPKPGVWWDVKVLDFASLYPSIIKTRNLSYETIRCKHDECKVNLVPELGHWSCTKEVGIFSIVLGFIRDTRVKWFKPRSSDPLLDDLEKRQNNIIQSSLKVLINAGYGVFGSTAFDFYCPPVAESTTAYARDAILKTKEFVENQLNVNVLYGDTDSVFLHEISDEQINELIQWGNENIGVELGTDYNFRYIVFSDRKKNYFGVTTRGGTIVKGLMGKKSNTPKLIRDNFSKTLDILKGVETPDQFDNAKLRIRKLLKVLVSQLEKGEFSVEDASIRMSLSRKLREYATWTQPIQAIVQLFAAGIVEKGSIDIGDSVEFVKVNRPFSVQITKDMGLAIPPGYNKSSVIPVQLVDPESNLDGKPMIDIAESTFSQFLSSIEMSWEDIMGVQSLDDFF